MNLHNPKPPSSSSQQRMDEAMYELKETLALIRYEWPQVLEETTTPIEMAVSLLDDSSVGLAHKDFEFKELRKQVQQTLRKVINEHYEIFNNSIGSYHMLLNTIKDCQEDSKLIREMLEDTKKEAHDRLDVLNDLNNTLARYSEMIEILDAMNQLNQIPQQIEKLINDKKVHEIYDVISDAYKLAEQYNLWSLSAMASIKTYLELQLNNLFDMIIDELHNEIYLKTQSVATQSFAPENSNGNINGSSGSGAGVGSGLNSNSSSLGAEYWQILVQTSNPQLTSLKTLLTNSKNLEQYIYNSANLDIAEIGSCFSETVERFITRQLPKIHHFYVTQQAKQSIDNIDYSILLDSTLNSNTESFHYVYMLLFTAFKLNRLQQVLEILSNTNQHEFHTLIHTTTSETKLKNTQQLHKLSKLGGSTGGGGDLGDTAEHFVNAGASFNDSSVVILQDLFGNVFIKSLAVLQKHKVVQEIVKMILDEDRNSGKPKAAPSTIGSGISHSGPGTPRSSTPLPHSFTDSSSYFDKAWNSMQKELQGLMVNYIYDRNAFTSNNKHVANGKGGSSISSVVNSSLGVGSGALSSINGGEIYDVLKRNTFRFEDVSLTKSAKSTEELQYILNDMFPGFNINSDDKSTVLENLSPYIKNEKFNAMVEVLVPRNIFNMRIILESFLIYISGAQHLFNFGKRPVAENDSIVFFNVFMNSTFLPKLKDTLNGVLFEFLGGSSGDNGKEIIGGSFRSELAIIDQHQEVKSSNATTAVTSSLVDYSTNKTLTIYQNALDFQKLIMYICFVLNTSLTYRKGFGDLCLQYLKIFADNYQNHYKSLLEPVEDTEAEILRATTPNSAGSTATKSSTQINTWMRIPALCEISGKILKGGAETDELLEKEVEIMLANTNILTLSKDDFLDGDSFQQICHLLLTTTWILSWLPSMRKESNYNVYDDDTDDIKLLKVDKLKHDWSFLESGRSSTVSSNIDYSHIYLTLNSNMIGKFDDIVETFVRIREGALLSLRYDLRCKAIFYISRSYKICDWRPSSEPGDCDQFISEYNKQVFLVDNKLTQILLDENERDCIFVGLSKFLENLIILGSKKLSRVNANGIKRIMLNIFVLQQMLRNIMKNPELINFNKSSIFFEMFTQNDVTLLESINEQHNKLGLKEDDFKNLARLIYSEKLVDGGSSFNRGKYNDLLKKIQQIYEQ